MSLFLTQLVGKGRIDGIADFIGDFLAHVGDDMGNGHIDLRGQLRGDPVFQLHGQFTVQLAVNPGENFMR